MHRVIVYAVIFIVMTGCVKMTDDVEHGKSYVLEDLRKYPQDATAYAGNIVSENCLLAVQKKFERFWFAPWHYTEPPESLEAIQWPFLSYRSDNAYGENLQPLSQSWFDEMLERSNFAAYGSVNKYAIALHFSHLRNFPTHKPLFKNPKKAGEGFPFDYLQNSGVHANEPLFVSHYSKEGRWVYVFSSYATGWLPSHAIAYIPKRDTVRWQNARQYFIVRERVPVKTVEGQYVFDGRIGMMMPAIGHIGDEVRLLAVIGDVQGKACYTEAVVPQDAVAETPLHLDARQLPLIVNRMLESQYGWGGLYEERDCSSTLRDLFTPFGIWLPRNSYRQSKMGKVIELAGLSDAEKLERIKRDAVPFETLLYRKGHILLYLGTFGENVMVLHNLWGIKTTNGTEPSRKIVGKTVISTLFIGSELESYDKEKALLPNLESMNIITLPKLCEVVSNGDIE